MLERSPITSVSNDLFEGLRIGEYLDILQRRKWWIILTTIAVFVIVVVVVYRLPDVYRSETAILVDPQKVPDNYVPSTVSASVVDRLSTIRQQVMSPTRLKRIIDSLGLYSELKGRLTEQEIIEIMQNSTSLEVGDHGGRQLSVFRIGFHGRNPVEVAQVANQLAALFIEENLKVREQQFFGTAEFLDNELQETRKQLEEQEQEISRIRGRYFMDLPESQQYHLQALTSLRTQLRASLGRAEQAQQQKIYLQSFLASSNPTVDFDTGGNGRGASRLQPQIQKLESEIARFRTRYGDNHPDVRKLRAQLDPLKAQAKTEELNQSLPQQPAPVVRPVARNPVVEAQLHELTKVLEKQGKLQVQLQEQIDFHMSKLERIPAFEQRMTSVLRNYDTLNAHYRTLLDKKLSAEMARALETRQKGERFVILDSALVPQKPFAPKRFLLCFAGLVGGLVGGLGLAILAEMNDESVRSESEAEEIVGVSVLGQIPRFLTKAQRRWQKVRMLGAVAGVTASSAVLGVLISYLRGFMF